MMITKDMKVNEILDKDFALIDVFLSYDLPCYGCPGAEEETLEEAAEIHGIDLEKLLEDLNKHEL